MTFCAWDDNRDDSLIVIIFIQMCPLSLQAEIVPLENGPESNQVIGGNQHHQIQVMYNDDKTAEKACMNRASSYPNYHACIYT